MASVEERLAALETRLGLVETARTSMDEDQRGLLAQSQATGHLIQALSITQSEHTGEFRKVHAKLDKLAAGQETVIGLLNELIRRDDDGRIDEDGVSE